MRVEPDPARPAAQPQPPGGRSGSRNPWDPAQEPPGGRLDPQGRKEPGEAGQNGADYDDGAWM